MVTVENNGDLLFRQLKEQEQRGNKGQEQRGNKGQEIARLQVDALPDARILTDGQGRLLLLTGRTQSYTHGVLGDEIEAKSITLLEAFPKPRVIRTIKIVSSHVIEGIAPIWVDWDGDEKREIIVTLSNAEEGAQVVVYRESGEILAKGNEIGLGYRWLHQLAVAPFGPKGEMELVDILTPHLGGIVEFSRLEKNGLKRIANKGRFSSHAMGSRNLDMALAGDLDGDSRWEVLVPNQARTHLHAVQHKREGKAESIWNLPVGGKVSTNFAGVTLPNGKIAVGVGHYGKKLRIWISN